MTDYTGLKRLVDAAKPWVGTYAEWPETKGGKAMKNFCAAFKPKDADALIAENERLVAWREGLLKERAAHIRQRDQLKAENEALESSRAKLAGELSRLRAKHKDWSVDAAMGKGEKS